MATGSKTATAKSAPSPLPLFPEEGGAIQGDLFANFTGNEAGEAKKSNLETLETLNCDYQLIDTEKKRAEIIQKLLTFENSLVRYGRLQERNQWTPN